MPRLTSSDRVCCPRAVMYATPDVVRPSVQSKGGDVMPRPTSFDRVCFPRVVMSCLTRRRPTVCAVQGQ